MLWVKTSILVDGLKNRESVGLEEVQEGREEGTARDVVRAGTLLPLLLVTRSLNPSEHLDREEPS